ncbi:MAG TPA: HPF/RaiA family ribosome-associated protein [Burkholderiales bacterium]
MEFSLQIVLRHLAPSDALEARVRKDVAKLLRSYPRMVSCRVTVEETGKHRRQGRQFQVRIDARTPGKEIVAKRDHDEDVYVALREAFEAMKRQLKDAAKLARGEVKAHPAQRRAETKRER